MQLRPPEPAQAGRADGKGHGRAPDRAPDDRDGGRGYNRYWRWDDLVRNPASQISRPRQRYDGAGRGGGGGGERFGEALHPGPVDRDQLRRPHMSRTVRLRFKKFFSAILYSLLTHRFGEAAHPGPITYMHPCCGMNTYAHAFPDDQLVWAADKDPTSRAIVRRQYNVTCHGPLESLKPEDMPQSPVDLYLIGSDCRPWSIYGKQLGTADPRAATYWTHWKLIEMMDDR